MESEALRIYLAAAGLNGLMGVAIGAWAAHGLKGRLPDEALAWIETGASYQLWHAAALLGLAALAVRSRSRMLGLAGFGFGGGALVFAGSLYLYALLDQRWLAMITPLGGVLMIVGWLAIIGAAIRKGPVA